MNYYNENDPFSAAWLRELIKANLIVPGEVDERSIEEVQPKDVQGFTQCHFFAGIGAWSFALRNAGWADAGPVWTGSCPCPGFSAAGKGEGFEDARHLWPAWFRLIRECRPATIFGEQVSAAIGFGWLDLVQSDLETETYAVGKVILGAGAVGAPHRRQRLYFVADSCGKSIISRESAGRGCGARWSSKAERPGNAFSCSDPDSQQEYPTTAGRLYTEPGERSVAGNRGNSQHTGHDKPPPNTSEQGSNGTQGRLLDRAGDARDGSDAAISGRQLLTKNTSIYGSLDGSAKQEPDVSSRRNVSDGHNTERPGLEGHFGNVRDWRGSGWLDPVTARSVAEAGATRGFWADCDWWYGRDGKYRPIKPGVFPLVTRAPARVGRLRGYGNAICAPVAEAFIKAYLETR